MLLMRPVCRRERTCVETLAGSFNSKLRSHPKGGFVRLHIFASICGALLKLAYHCLRDTDVARIVEIERIVGTANVVKWARLALADLQAPVLRVKRLQHDDQDRPIALEIVVLVLARFPGLEGDGGAIPEIGELARRYSLSLSGTRERLSLAQATSDVALHLGTSVGADVLKRDRVVETADGEPLEWLVAFSRL
jgi:DNA-binding GntR family transcriptional regulator